MDLVTTTRCSKTLPSGGRTSSRLGEQARATVCRADYSTENAKGVMLPAKDPEAPRSWDKLTSKFDRRFSALLKKLKTIRVELEDARRQARTLGNTLLREAMWNG